MDALPLKGLPRFTPTRVGTTTFFYQTNKFLSVHPHACGDDSISYFFIPSSYGSPPRVWGRRKLTKTDRGVYRFTPTRVGTTTICYSSYATTSVHPHACGDDL